LTEAEWREAEDLHLSASQSRFGHYASSPSKIFAYYSVFFLTKQIPFPYEVANSFSGYSSHGPDVLVTH
jgi:hypothetical protein